MLVTRGLYCRLVMLNHFRMLILREIHRNNTQRCLPVAVVRVPPPHTMTQPPFESRMITNQLIRKKFQELKHPVE